MGEHVKESVSLEIESSQVSAGPDATDREKLEAILSALADEDVDVEITTNKEND